MFVSHYNSLKYRDRSRYDCRPYYTTIRNRNLNKGALRELDSKWIANKRVGQSRPDPMKSRSFGARSRTPHGERPGGPLLYPDIQDHEIVTATLSWLDLYILEKTQAVEVPSAFLQGPPVEICPFDSPKFAPDDFVSCNIIPGDIDPLKTYLFAS